MEYRGRKLCDFTQWDYLNLNQNEAVRRAAHTEIEANGTGTHAPRLATGTLPVHLACEARLASFLSCESALLFSSRTQAIFSLITATIQEGDVLLVEEGNRSAISDAAYLVDAQLVTFSGTDLKTLSAALERFKGKNCLVVIESLSQLTGRPIDLLAVIHEVTRYGVDLVIDETYALAGIGARGAGICNHYNIIPKLYTIVGGLGLTLGAAGGFIAGSAPLVSYLTSRSKTFQIEPSMAPLLAASTEAAISAAEVAVHGRLTLSLLRERLCLGLKSIGIDLMQYAPSPIVSIPVSRRSDAEAMAELLFQKNFLVESVSAGVPRSEQAFVRIVLSAHHTERQIEQLLEPLSEVILKLKINA